MRKKAKPKAKSYEYTPVEFVAKIDYEGGVWDTMLGYGLAEDVLPPCKLRNAYGALRKAMVKLKPLIDDLECAILEVESSPEYDEFQHGA